MTYEKEPILTTLARIDNGELVLPAIQRDFVWEPERMYKLLDSVFRGYPFSTMLFWNTKQRIQYRLFTKEWEPEVRYTFRIKEESVKGTMVLDGQQRLQTLYLALYGSYNQKILYFDLLSGEDHHDSVAEARYHFEYLSALEAEAQNKEKRGEQYWVPLRDLMNLHYDQLVARTMHYLQLAGVAADSAAGKLLGDNLGLTYGRMKGDENLNYFTVDKEFGEDGIATNLDEILEIFVRVNSGGQVLSKSDLMFSLMQMLWEGAADAISDVIEDMNRKGRFDFDKDFVLKCALVCCGKGAKYEVSKLRDAQTVELIKNEFPKINLALENFMDFMVNQAKIIDDRILRSYNTVIPFVYFYYKQPNQNVHGEETLLRIKQALYLTLMTSLYSRFADNYIDRTTHNILDVALEEKPDEFPLEELTRFVYERTGHNEFNDGLLQSNLMLLMNILEGGRRLPEGKLTRSLEIDHIFPKSKLEVLGIPEELRNHYANFRLIQPMDNNWKRAQDPAPYFAKNPGALKYYLIPGDCLEYDHYPQFLEKRRAEIWKRVNQFFGMGGSATILLNTPEVFTPVPQTITQASSSLKQELEALLDQTQKEHPVLKDQSIWWKVYQATGLFNNVWAGRYHDALKTAGINNVADFAAAVMALGLKTNGRSSGHQRYKFARSLPGGKIMTIRTRDFGGWAWHEALAALEKRDFNWREYLVS